MCVVLSHLENQFDTPTPFTQALAFLTLDAQNAVNFFFVLSGFLITLLLLRERIASKRISIRNFYIRRSLRIWPLYYAIALIGLFVFPRLFGTSYPLTATTPLQLLLVLALLPNFAGLTAPLVHLWSIGVEEQFYAFWPWAARRDGFLLRVILGIFILKFALLFIGALFMTSAMLALFMDLRFESMAIGALVAYVYTNKPRLLKWLYRPLTQWLAAILTLCFVVWSFPQALLVELVSSCSFAIIILNVATNPRAWLRLNYTWSERLGEISYGIYMYHFPLLYLCVFALARFPLPESSYMPLLYFTTITATLLTSQLSYQYFEKPILRQKAHLSRSHTDIISTSSEGNLKNSPSNDETFYTALE